MKLHPASKAAASVLRKAGLTVHRVGTLSFHVVCREWNARPLIIDIRCSAHEDKARIEVPWFNDQHSMYSQVSKLNGLEFAY